MGKPKISISVFDPGFKLHGHNVYFNIHVLDLLSSIYDKVVYFDTDHNLKNSYLNKPDNVKIIELPLYLKVFDDNFDINNKSTPYRLYAKILKKIILRFNNSSFYYKSLWKFMKYHPTDILLFTSEGSRKVVNLFKNPPPFPYTLLIHIVWQIIGREDIPVKIKQFLKNASALFVLEDYLREPLLSLNPFVFRFPFYTYEEDFSLPSIKTNKGLKIGTIGIINERRNIDFILKSLQQYHGPHIEYSLCGIPVGDFGDNIVKLAAKKLSPSVKLITIFRYLTDLEYNTISSDLDFVLIAYDSFRELQAPGAIYQFCKNNVPLITPKIEPFITIEETYPGLMIFYNELSTQSLIKLIGQLAEKGSFYQETMKKFKKGVSRLIQANTRTKQIEILKKNLIPLTNRVIINKMSKQNSSKNIFMFFPVFNDVGEINDQLSRAAWYLSCMNPKKIIVPVSENISDYSFSTPDYLDENTPEYFEKIKNNLEIIRINKTDTLVQHYEKSNIILQWKEKEYPSEYWEQRLKVKKGKQIWNLDRNEVRYEGSKYIKVGFSNYPEMSEDISKNKKKFADFIQEVGHYKNSYVFGTGPSVGNYKDFSFSDGISIICNSVVFDDELLDYVQPKVLVFADPIFHFGVSQYASTFRKKMIESVIKHKMYVFIPFNYYRLFMSHYKELNKYLIGIPFDYEKPINFDISKDFYLNPFMNILTVLMLPIASTVSDNIHFLGVDGRKKTDDEYFWKHNEKTQINDKMENIKLTHPGFFNIDYNEYFDNHTAVLDKQIAICESNGKHISALTPSYVDLFRRRYKYRSVPAEAEFYPKISYIVYLESDHERLKYTVQSILQQNYPVKEIILLQAENSHNKYLATLIEDLNDFFILHKLDSPDLSKAYNWGYEHSSGEYIVFIREGDVLFKNTISEAMSQMVINDWGIAYFKNKIINTYRKILDEIPAFTPVKYSFFDSQIEIPLPSLIFRKKVFTTKKPFDENPEYNYNENIDVIQRLTRQGNIIHYIDNVYSGTISPLKDNNEKNFSEQKLSNRRYIQGLLFTKDIRVTNPLAEYNNGIHTAAKIREDSICNFKLLMHYMLIDNEEKAKEIASDISCYFVLSVDRYHLHEMIFQTAKQSLMLNDTKTNHYLIQNKEKIEDFLKELLPDKLINYLQLRKMKSFTKQPRKEDVEVYNPIFPVEFPSTYKNYDGKIHNTIKFDAKNYKVFKIDFMISIFDSSAEAKIYDKFHPSMPMRINPILIYQLPRNILRIFVRDIFDFSITIIPEQWYKVTFKINPADNIFEIMINDMPILRKNVKLHLTGQGILGKGLIERYWKGKIGDFAVHASKNNKHWETLINP